MNIQQEEAALRKLPPQKYTIRILTIAVCSLFSLVVGGGNYLKNENAKLQTENGKCNEENKELLKQWKDADNKKSQEELKKALADKERADSILMITISTKENIKKAIKYEKRKR